MNNDHPIKVIFSQGTLLLDTAGPLPKELERYAVFDDRVKMYRAPAMAYGPIVLKLHRGGIPYEDLAKKFNPIALSIARPLPPLPHQAAALDAWRHQGRRGVVVLPTGSGKSYLAMLAMADVKRPTLVAVPTIDLMQQWAGQLERYFQQPVGMLGGGSKEIQALTVTTYDSAVLMMEYIGDRFGFLICDECHHLPGKVKRNAAVMSIAPFRLGLTATPERSDDGEAKLYELLGPAAYRIDIDQLEGKVLAPYETREIELNLDPDETADYTRHRANYVNFVRRCGVSFQSSDGWVQFLAACARQPGGREAFQSYLAQKRIARGGRSKLRKLWELLRQHRHERMIVFTAENDTAYEIGNAFVLPVITHQTKAAERKEMLDKFRAGEYPALVTSNVLNEGVDVPEASVGVVISGSGSIREHVQRLGRILRASAGKQAVLYELVSRNTSEVAVSQRRREHRAYRHS